MPADRSDESWRNAALLLDMVLAAEGAVSFAAGLGEAAFLASDLHQSAVLRPLLPPESGHDDE
jgi:uncharacterized protein with HEPN domain